MLSSTSFLVYLPVKQNKNVYQKGHQDLISVNGNHAQLYISSALNKLIFHWIISTLMTVCMSTIPNPV